MSHLESDLWLQVLRTAGGLHQAGASPSDAVMAASIAVSERLRRAVLPIFKVDELARIPIAPAVDDVSAISDAIAGEIESAIKLTGKLGLEPENEESLACLLFATAAVLPDSEKSRFGLPAKTDRIWTMARVRESLRAMKEAIPASSQTSDYPGEPEDRQAQPLPAGRTDRASESRPGEAFVTDLVPRAGEPIVLPSVEENIRTLLLASRRRRRRAVVLLAPPGMGKSFTVEQLAARIRAGMVPDDLRSAAVLKVNLAAVISGQVAETAKNLHFVFRVAESYPRAFLFFDELQGFLKTGNEGHQVETTAALKMLFSSDMPPGLTVIAATTRKEFDVFVRSDRALERRLIPVQIKMPDGREEVDAVLAQVKAFAGGAAIDESLAREALKQAKSNFPSRPSLDCALDLLDGACARSSAGADLSAALKDEVSGLLEQATGLSGAELPQAQIAERLSTFIVGQPHVVHQLSTAISVSFLGIGRARGPRNVFLFVGPPGVGKTHSARAYKDLVQASRFVHLHMADYSDPQLGHTKLLGGSPEYKNAEVGSLLINTVRDHSSAVILFDEIDQAAPQVKDALYRLLDEGVMTDGFGNDVDFSRTTVFLTTNAGAMPAEPESTLGFVVAGSAGTKVTEMQRADVLARLEKHFTAAFLSRIGVAVMFQPLSLVNLAEVAEMKIREQGEMIRERTGLRLELGSGLGDALVVQAGVRHDARAIERALEESFWPRLSQILLASKGEWQDFTTLRIDAELPIEATPLQVLLLDDHAEEEERRTAGLASIANIQASSDFSAFSSKLSQFDVVLLDLDWGHGPEEGLKMLKAIARNRKAPPVLLYTSISDHETRMTYYREGAEGFVAKGSPELLGETLRRFRRERQLRKLGERAEGRQFRVVWEDPVTDAETLRLTLTVEE